MTQDRLSTGVNMATDTRLLPDRFPRSAGYHPDWIIPNSFGSHPLWIAEWLAGGMDFQPGQRVLDLGCGKALSSIFLAREFGVQVWAVDLWIAATDNLQRIRDADLADRVFPLHADARGLPFAGGFFDAIVCHDCFSYFGTDDLYLNYLANFVRDGGRMGMAGAGLMRELDGPVPEHLRSFWTHDFWCLHSADWWRRHWERTGIVDLELADAMPDGWRVWLDWHSTAHPANRPEIEALGADRGRYFGYVRMVGRRRADVKLEEYCWPDNLRSFPPDYEAKPLLRMPASNA